MRPREARTGNLLGARRWPPPPRAGRRRRRPKRTRGGRLRAGGGGCPQVARRGRREGRVLAFVAPDPGMAGKGSYVPPQYIPLYSLDTEEDRVPAVEENHAARHKLNRDPTQWSSGICACFDDPQSCCLGATCPCFLFGKNAQFLGSGTLAGSCTTHCMLWGLLTSLCCVFTGGLVLAVPGSAVACYACGYRSALRTKYNLPEAPCGDLTTHLFCHLCAICQEYREIRERTGSSSSAPHVTPPPVQTMDEP